MTEQLHVLWRIDDDFNFTSIDVEFATRSSNEILIECIRVNAKEIYVSDEHDRMNTIESMIDMATDLDHPKFVGYEIPMKFVADLKHLRFV